MNVRTPTLRQHSDGRWITKWGGKIHYFGRDRAIAVRRFADSLEAWSDWRDAIKALKPSSMPRLSVISLAEQFVTAKELDRGRGLREYYKKHLRRFLTHAGPVHADTIRVGTLQHIKHDMQQHGFAPKTINHDIIAIRAMFQWAMDLELIPPVNLKGCKPLKLPPPPDKSLSAFQVHYWVHQAPEPVRPWLGLNYLTVTRPSEVVKVVNRQGHWSEPWLFRLDRGKTDLATGTPRHIVFSPLALGYLKQCRPVWKRLDSYSAAVRRDTVASSPGLLRHSAATHLHQAGVSREDVDAIRGTLPTRVSLSYVQIHYEALRASLDLLTL